MLECFLRSSTHPCQLHFEEIIFRIVKCDSLALEYSYELIKSIIILIFNIWREFETDFLINNFVQYLRQYLQTRIYFSGQLNMTQKSHHFQKIQLEIEQGQIPNNSFDMVSLSLKGGANNSIIPLSSNIFKNNIDTQSRQEPHIVKGYTNGQTEYQEQGKVQKKYQKMNQSLFNSNASTTDVLAKNGYWGKGSHTNSNSQRNSFYYGSVCNSDNQSQNAYLLNKNKFNGNKKQAQNTQDQGSNQTKLGPMGLNSLKKISQVDTLSKNYNSDQKFPQLLIENCKKQAETPEISDPRKRKENGIQTNKKGYVPRKGQKLEKEWIIEKDSIKAQIEEHEAYFRGCDWQRLLFIIQEIILDNNNGIRQLWNFINSYPGNMKYRKGMRVFRILDGLGLEQVFDKLIIQEQKYRKERKQKETKTKSLIFGLIRKID